MKILNKIDGFPMVIYIFTQKEHSPTLVFVIAVYYLKKDHQWYDVIMHKLSSNHLV